MLTLYRRHTEKCVKKRGRLKREHRKCSCPMWVEGTLNREYMRKALHTQSWERAKAITDAWEAAGAEPEAKATVPTVTEAFDQYIADRKDANLAEQSIIGYAYILGRFAKWLGSNNYKFISEITTPTIRDFFGPRNVSAATRKYERRVLRQAFKFAIARKWIDDDPTQSLPRIIVRHKPTEYLDKQEFSAFLDNIGGTNPQRMRALVLLMRWSGLRIGDALRLERSSINHGILMLHQQKTGTPVSLPLPPVVLDVLNKLPVIGRRYFILDGDKPKKYAEAVREEFHKAGKRAGISKRIHPHMLRDTFAVELLLAAVPLEEVSKLLGHSSVKTTEEHYSPWVRARQEQLNEHVRSAWA